MNGDLVPNHYSSSFISNHFSSSLQYCYTPDCFVSVEDKYVDLDRVHQAIDCPKYINKEGKLQKRAMALQPRGALAKTLYKKHQNDCKLQEIDKYEWYRCNISTMRRKTYKRFIQLSADAKTREFISNSIEKSSWVWTQIWHSLAKSFLSYFMTRTDINGWLGRGSMFVLSVDQITHLLMSLDFHKRSENSGKCTLIDVGAGDGEVTVRWKDLFTDIYATEMSRTMRVLLETKGFTVLDTDNWWTGDKFDVVCMLNLLDRCSEPITMMLNAREAVTDNGLIIIALVLPFKAYYEYEVNHKPKECLPISGQTFEDHVESFIDFAESKIGLNLVLWSKVPYLCEGDIDQSYYWLNDAIFIFEKNSEVSITSS